MRKIVAMAVICLTAASGLTSAYAAQLADDEAGLRTERSPHNFPKT